jgi:hypothetical protein
MHSLRDLVRKRFRAIATESIAVSGSDRVFAIISDHKSLSVGGLDAWPVTTPLFRTVMWVTNGLRAALQSKIQMLGKPWYRRRMLRVFRDDTSLSAIPSLWPSIEKALSESRYFVLIAPPESAASNWG